MINLTKYFSNLNFYKGEYIKNVLLFVDFKENFPTNVRSFYLFNYVFTYFMLKIDFDIDNYYFSHKV